MKCTFVGHPPMLQCGCHITSLEFLVLDLQQLPPFDNFVYKGTNEFLFV
jgi:hypothetical protein